MSRALLLTWSLLHKLSPTSNPIFKFSNELHGDPNVTVSILESHSPRPQCLHAFAYVFVAWPSFIWQSLGGIKFGYICKMPSV